MSKILILADIHGNMTALNAFEKEIERVAPDEIWFNGDSVGKGPQNDKTCDWVKNNCSVIIGGNWDYGIERENIEKDEDLRNLFYHKQLGPERINWLTSLPREMDFVFSGICFRMFHGRPAVSLFQGYDSDERFAPAFTANGKNYGGIICSDSHRPFVRLTAEGYAINTGSVGNSLGRPLANGLLLEGEKDCEDPAPLRITTLCVPYDNQKEADIADSFTELPKRKAYIQEVLTGVYSR